MAKKTYTADQVKEVVAKAKEIGAKPASEFFKVSYQTVLRWMEKSKGAGVRKRPAPAQGSTAAPAASNGVAHQADALSAYAAAKASYATARANLLAELQKTG